MPTTRQYRRHRSVVAAARRPRLRLRGRRILLAHVDEPCGDARARRLGLVRRQHRRADHVAQELRERLFLDTFPFRPAPSAAKSALMASSAHSISWKVTTWATRGSPGGLVRLVQAEEDRLRTPDERLAGQKLSRAAGGAV